MSELDDVRDKLVQILGEIFSWDWYSDPDQCYLDAIDEILSLSTDTCRIAVVRRRGELPGNPHGIAVDRDPETREAYKEAQQKMLKAGYVQEV